MIDRTATEIANEFVPISVILDWAGVYVPDTAFGKSWKTVCPFGEIYHIDGATDKCLRYYQATNSAYCFQGCGYLTPVNLYARLQGFSYQEAAEDLLIRSKYEDVTDEQKWQEALKLKLEIDHSYLKSALQTFCSRKTKFDWAHLQYEDIILRELGKCFALLEHVKTSEDAKSWLTASKDYMSGVLNEF